MNVNREINRVAKRISEELAVDVDLAIGSVEDTAQAVPVLCERMDNICTLMDYQAEFIARAERVEEEKKYLYKRKELQAKQKYNIAFTEFKQADRPRPKTERRTDKEVEALAKLEAFTEEGEVLTSEREYQAAKHDLENEKNKYEVLNNHFLSYRKASDMLMKEMNTISGNTAYRSK